MKLTLRTPGGDRDVVVEGAGRATLAEVLRAAGEASAQECWVDGGVALPPTTSLAEVAIDGSVLATVVTVARAEPVVALRAVAGLQTGVVVPLSTGLHTIGGASFADPSICPTHVEVRSSGNGELAVRDLGSRTGASIGGRPLVPLAEATPVPRGELVGVGSLVLDVIEPLPGTPPGGPVHRPPRAVPEPASPPVALPAAAALPSSPPRFSWAMVVAPMLLGAVLAVLVDPRMAVFAALGPVVAVATWAEERQRAARATRRAAAADVAACSRLEAELAGLCTGEAARRRRRWPGAADAVCRAAGAGSLWSRRGDDAAIGTVSVGLGRSPWSPAVVRPAAAVPGADELVSSVELLDCPITVSVGPGQVLGIAGPRPSALAVARGVILQVAADTGPADLAIEVTSAHDDWQWSAWLPHVGVVAGWRLVVCDGTDPLAPSDDVGVVVVAESIDDLPSSCTAVVELVGDEGSATVTDLVAGLRFEGVRGAGVPEPVANGAARALARRSDPAADAATAPSVGLAELLGGASPSQVAARWGSPRRGDHLAVALGTSVGWRAVVDLVADGPHALVVGTTGSGKSELLRAWVAALAASAPPELVTFLLVDFKGGSAFAECAALPHVVGVVTDLDEHLAARALRSLEAELRHRERVLASSGARDLTAHRALGGSEALPRLVVVIDELATLVRDLAGFVPALVDIAQRGRSLGVHLVLATQQAAGVVSDAVRANTAIRIALRTQDEADARDVVGVAEPARFDPASPGRAILRCGPRSPVALQVARTSGTSTDTGEVRVRPLGSAPTQVAGSSETLGAVVAAVVAAAEAAGCAPPRRPFAPPLAESIDLGSLLDADGAVFGMLDDPDAQCQRPLVWRPADGHLLVVGIPGSGTSTALASLGMALARWRAPDALHIFALDVGGRALSALAGLPHVGAVVGARDRQARLLRHLRREVEARATGASAGVGPEIVCLVDNAAGLYAAFDDLPGLEVLDDLARVAADGPAVGVVLALACDRPFGLPASLTALVPNRLVLRLADAHDAVALGVGAVPPGPAGRGVWGPTGLAAQVAVSHGTEGVRGGPRSAPAIGTLPDTVPLGALSGAGGGDGRGWFLPVGVGDTELAPAGWVLADGEHLLVTGPARSGRSTLLSVVARQAAALRPDLRVVAVAGRTPSLPGVGVMSLDAAIDTIGQEARPTLLLVDDADLVDDPDGRLAALLVRRHPWLSVVAAGRGERLWSAYGHWTAEVRRARTGFALRPTPEVDGDLWGVALPRTPTARRGPGRGVLVADGSVEVVQVALPDGPAGLLEKPSVRRSGVESSRDLSADGERGGGRW